MHLRWEANWSGGKPGKWHICVENGAICGRHVAKNLAQRLINDPPHPDDMCRECLDMVLHIGDIRCVYSKDGHCRHPGEEGRNNAMCCGHAINCNQWAEGVGRGPFYESKKVKRDG